VQSATELAVAFVLIWDVSKNDGGAVDLFKIIKLLSEPAKHVSRVLELNHAFPVEIVTDVGIESDHLGVRLTKLLSLEVCQRKRIVTPVLKQLNLLGVFNEGVPVGRPLVNRCVLLRDAHPDHILRIGVVVADGWEHFQTG
jgi:hypothetical protein